MESKSDGLSNCIRNQIGCLTLLADWSPAGCRGDGGGGVGVAVHDAGARRADLDAASSRPRSLGGSTGRQITA